MEMHGDDEMNAILAEMGSAPSPAQGMNSTIGESTSHQPNQTQTSVDPRLLDNPWQWPLKYRLHDSLKAGECLGWKGDYGKSCQVCGKGSVFHRLVSKKGKKVSFLRGMFCAVRNLRCASSENILSDHEYDSLYQMIQKQLNNDSQLLKQLSDIDRRVLKEKVKDLEYAVTRMKRGGINDSIEKFQSRMRVIITADLLYYRIYYASLTSESEPCVPSPSTFFACPGLAWDVDAGQQTARDFVNNLDTKHRQLLTKTYGLWENVGSNPLHILWQHRFMEMIRNFWASGYASSQTPKALATGQLRPSKTQKEFPVHETLADPVLADWRDAARDFPASLYAYATPSPKAIERIKEHVGNNTVVEMGAGTGYWAALLRSSGVDITAYDLSPPGCYSDNDYHSEVPPFTNVHQRDAGRSTSAPVLFLCYPVPGTNMAVSALEVFQGEMVLHVGEWAGLTGDTAFERLLIKRFSCCDYVPLPCWGTDAAFLTIWKRQGTTKYCNVATGGCVVCNKDSVGRCRFARSLQYCSVDCFNANENDRKYSLRIQMLDSVKQDVEWNNTRHFQLLGGRNTDPTEQHRNHKRRKI